MSDKLPTVAFKTLGCRLNQAETARMRAAFSAAGYTAVPFTGPADVCVVHGCAVTARAERESRRWLRVARRRSPHARVVLTGCAASVPGLRQPPAADCMLGRQPECAELPEVLQPATAFRSLGDAGSPPLFDQARALLKIQDGCDFRCAYCIVPVLRGPARSRPADSVLREARALAEHGFKELVVTGANIGCYSDRGRRLPELLAALDEVAGIERIRLSSIEISTVEDGVLDWMETSRKACRFLHLPLQSGDDAVLRRMGRKYDAKKYCALVERVGARLGDCGLGADVLVGFPGESETAFANSERLVRELPFNNVHVFAYSARPGTAAARFTDAITVLEKKRRAQRMMNLALEKRSEFAQRWIGRTVSVLVEKTFSDGSVAGLTREYVAARGAGLAARRGDIVAAPGRSWNGRELVLAAGVRAR